MIPFLIRPEEIFKPKYEAILNNLEREVQRIVKRMDTRQSAYNKKYEKYNDPENIEIRKVIHDKLNLIHNSREIKFDVTVPDYESKNPETDQLSLAVSKRLSDVWKNNRFYKVVNKILLDREIYAIGICAIYYNKSYNVSIKSNGEVEISEAFTFPMLERIRPSNFGVYDEENLDLDSQEIVVARTIAPRVSVARMIGAELAEQLETVYGAQKYTNTPEFFGSVDLSKTSPIETLNLNPEYLQQEGAPRETFGMRPDDLVVAYEVWVLDDVGNYRYCIFGGEQSPKLLYIKENMYSTNMLPYCVIRDTDEDVFFPEKSTIDILLPSQEHVNKKIELVRKLNDLQGDPPLLIPVDRAGMAQLKPEEIRGWYSPGKVVPLTIGMQPPIPLNTVEVPATIPMEIEILEKKMQDGANFPNVLAGQMPKGVKTGRSTANLLAQGMKVLAQQATDIVCFVEDCALKLFYAMYQYDTQVLILDNGKKYLMANLVDKSDINNVKIRVFVYSIIPSAQTEFIDTLTQMGELAKFQIFDPEILIDLLDLPVANWLKEKLKQKALVAQQERQQEMQLELQKKGVKK